MAFVSDWKRKRLGGMFAFGVERRQIRVGRAAEPVLVIRVCENLVPGDELVLTRSNLRFATIGVDSEERRGAEAAAVRARGVV
jgi:hypothetical protein